MSIGHKAMLYGAKTAAGVTLDLLSNPALVQSARAEFDTRRKGRTYKCALPADLAPPLDQLEPA